MTKVVTYIEIDVPMCSLEFSVSPCSAEYESSCFKTLHTCKDVNNYSETFKTVRFGYPDADDQSGIDYIPSVQSVSYRPQQISLEGDMGIRASLTCSFRDHRDSDTYEAGDPYWSRRGYNPFEQGTFWGKWQARHYPKMQGAIIRYIRGTEGQNVAAMESRTFIIEKITGPDKSGKVSITAKDILKLTDDKKAQCPVLSTGRLNADLTDSATSATLTPSGVGDDEYPASGHVAIGGKEICSFTRSGDVLTLTRAQFNTDAAAHDQNDIVQLCKEFFDGANGLDPADIIYDLLVNYTTTPSSWINLTDWQAKTEQFLGGRLYYTLVAEPTSVKDLINELLEQAGLILYTDDLNQQIRLDALRELTTPTIEFDADNIVSGSFDSKRQPEKRLSQVWTWYGLRNPLESIDEETNYRAAVSHIDTLAESLYGGQPAIKKIYSRWINARPAGADLCYKLLSRFRDPPSLVKFAAWRFGETVPAHAGRYTVEMWQYQTATGEQMSLPIQVTKVTPQDAAVTVEAQEISWYEYDDQPDQGLLVVIENDVTDFNFRTEYDKSYAAPESGDVITCLIEEGVKVGTSTNSGYAFSVGTWSESGITLRLINGGYIVGKGGDGGSSPGTKSGEDGADALYTRQAITITNTGTIGGGGGGGGLGGYASTPNPHGGGGGGAGYLVGQGGTAYGSNGEDGTTTDGGNAGFAALSYHHHIYELPGGNGGALGQDGQDALYVYGFFSPGDGGSAGVAVDGDSYITWVASGTIAGSQIN